MLGLEYDLELRLSSYGSIATNCDNTVTGKNKYAYCFKDAINKRKSVTVKRTYLTLWEQVCIHHLSAVNKAEISGPKIKQCSESRNGVARLGSVN